MHSVSAEYPQEPVSEDTDIATLEEILQAIQELKSNENSDASDTSDYN